MTNLRSSLIRLAHANPELRAQILPLLTEKSASPTPETRLASLTVKLASRPMLQPLGLNERAVREGMASMLYFIDGSRNHSKFYEMLIVPSTTGTYTLIKKWGALTDSPLTGNTPEKIEDFVSLQKAQAMLSKTYREKVGKGYVDAFNPRMHVSPMNGEKLPEGQYPVGLKRSVGFGWGTQSATQCIPSLRNLAEKIDAALNEMGEGSDLLMLLADLEDAQNLIKRLMTNPDAVASGTNDSLGDILNKALSTPIKRVRLLEKLPVMGGAGRLPREDREVLTSELKTIRNYVLKQLSHCA
jgi:predicted DNA-binding WGR domain protein